MNRPTLFDIASHFCVSRIIGATIPATRLSNILEKMFRGRPLTALSLRYLQQQNLTELHQLASGQITYESYISALDPALLAREQAAKVEHHAKEAERLALEKKRSLESQRKAETEEAARIAHDVRKNEQVAQYNRGREAAETARKKREAEWAVQGKHNRDAAEARYKARMRNPDYIAPTPNDIARHYHLNHLPSASTSPLSNILNALYQGRPLAEAYLNYLRIKGLTRLYELAIGQTTYEIYISGEVARKIADADRLKLAEVQRLQLMAAEIARVSRENDPAYILCKKYGIPDLDQSLLPRIMAILQAIDSGNRLSNDDLFWLKAQQCLTEELRKAYHLLEAEFCSKGYRRTQDPWKAINASAHFRKCNQPESALELLASVPVTQLKHPKIHSAMCTTRGGAMRDQGRHDEALQLGKLGHELQPRNFRPCTLLGAVCMELGNFGEGHDWYAKAEQRGAKKQGIDYELRDIFLRLGRARRAAMKVFLLEKDPNRYRWVHDKNSHRESTSTK